MKTIIRYSFHLVTAVALLLLGWVWLKHYGNLEAARTITRLTARMSMIIFLFVFSASSWHRISHGDWSTALLKKRRRLGLTFAYSHTIHLVCIVTYFLLAGSRPALSTLAVGGGAYVAMYLMAITSNDRAVSKLGARTWKRIHRIGIYYLWAVFFLTYLTRSLASQPVEGSSRFASIAIDIAGMILLLGVMALRVATAVRTRARSAEAVA